MTVRKRVWFHRLRAVAWLIVGVVSFPLGWANNITIVWLASVYANVVSDLGASEAADDRELIERLDRIEKALNTLLDQRSTDGR